MKDKLDVAVTLLLAITALAVLLRGAGGDPAGEGIGPKQLSDWRAVSAEGVWLGPEDADVVITSFVDFQCPFCARMYPLLDSLMAAHPRALAVSLVHLPLPGHTEAIPAAKAVECAAAQGKGREFVGLLYGRQAEFDSRPWIEVAATSGVVSTEEFVDCIGRPAEDFPRILRGQAIAEERGIFATPATWVNGRGASGADIASSVDKLVR